MSSRRSVAAPRPRPSSATWRPGGRRMGSIGSAWATTCSRGAGPPTRCRSSKKPSPPHAAISRPARGPHFSRGARQDPYVCKGSSTRQSPNVARPSGSSPTTTRNTTTSASPWRGRRSGGPSPPGDVRIPARPRRDHGTTRGDRRLPRDDPDPARPRQGPLYSRRRPEWPGPARRSHRGTSRGDPAQARPRRGPLQPGHDTQRPGRLSRGARHAPPRARTGPAAAQLAKSVGAVGRRDRANGDDGRTHPRDPQGRGPPQGRGRALSSSP